MRAPAPAHNNVQGLIEAAKQLGLPLPRLTAEAHATPSPPVQRSAPARLALQGTSPDSNSPVRAAAKRPTSSVGVVSKAEQEQQTRSTRRRVSQKPAVQRIPCRDIDSLALNVIHTKGCTPLQSYCQLQEANVAANERIAQLLGELGHWQGQAQSLATEAQQLRHRLVFCEMQLATTQQQLQVVQAQPGAAQAPQPWAPALPAWGSACMPPPAPSMCAPVQMETEPMLAPLSTAALPTCMGLPSPAGPLPVCDDWDDVLLPDFPL